MPYDEQLAERIRALLANRTDVEERRMFGGLAFMVNGNLCVAASGAGGLLARVDKDDAEDLLASEPRAEPMEMRGRPMRGWLRVPLEAVAEDDDLERWVRRSEEFAASLEPK